MASAWAAMSSAADDKSLDKTVVLRVLIAEDEEFQRESLDAMFKSANNSLAGSIFFDARLVPSADQVLETLRQDTNWQLVMLDVFMPGRHGDEIIGDVRSILGDKVPLLMISAGAQMGAVQRCLRLGADTYAPASNCRRLMDCLQPPWPHAAAHCRAHCLQRPIACWIAQVYREARPSQRGPQPVAALHDQGPDTL